MSVVTTKATRESRVDGLPFVDHYKDLQKLGFAEIEKVFAEMERMAGVELPTYERELVQQALITDTLRRGFGITLPQADLDRLNDLKISLQQTIKALRAALKFQRLFANDKAIDLQGELGRLQAFRDACVEVIEFRKPRRRRGGQRTYLPETMEELAGVWSVMTYEDDPGISRGVSGIRHGRFIDFMYAAYQFQPDWMRPSLEINKNDPRPGYQALASAWENHRRNLRDRRKRAEDSAS